MKLGKRRFVKKQLLLSIEMIILSSSFLFLSIGSVDNFEMSLTNEFEVLMVGNTKVNAMKTTLNTLESLVGASVNLIHVTDYKTFIDILQNLKIPNLVIIGHGTESGLVFEKNNEVPWKKVTEILMKNEKAFNYLHVLSCFSSNMKQYFLSPKLCVTSKGVISAEQAALSVARHLMSNFINRYYGKSNFEKHLQNYFLFIKKSRLLANKLIGEPFPSGYTLSGHTTNRTKITAAVMVGNSDHWDDNGWNHPTNAATNVKNDIQNWTSSLNDTFGIEVSVEFVDFFDNVPGQAEETYNIRGTDYWASDNLKASMLQGMDAFPGDFHPSLAINDYDILIVYVFGHDGGDMQSWANGWGSVVVCSYDQLWRNRVKLCHEISHLYGAEHTKNIGGIWSEFDPCGVLNSWDDYYEETTGISNGFSIMDYADCTGHFSFWNMPNTWDSHNHNTINNTYQRERFADTDPDQDGLDNVWEYILGYLTYDDDTGNTGYLDGDKDYDGDGFSNADELDLFNTDPLVPDAAYVDSSSSIDFSWDTANNHWDVTATGKFYAYTTGTFHVHVQYKINSGSWITPTGGNQDRPFSVGMNTVTLSNIYGLSPTNTIHVRWQVFEDNDPHEESRYGIEEAEVLTSCYVIEDYYDFYSGMTFSILGADTYYIKIEWRFKPDGGSWGSWTTERWVSQFYAVNTYTFYENGICSGYYEGGDMIEVRWSIYHADGTTLVDSRSETCEVS